MKFFDEKKQEDVNEYTKCLNHLDSKLFYKHCVKVCPKMNISKILDVIEGDFDFINDAVNLFEKFFEYKESGNFISMKLRLFFKKFVIPTKLDENGNRFLK